MVIAKTSFILHTAKTLQRMWWDKQARTLGQTHFARLYEHKHSPAEQLQISTQTTEAIHLSCNTNIAH